MSTETETPKRGPRAARAAAAEPQADAAIVDQVEQDEYARPEKTPVDGFLVEATRDGTYPNRGDTYGVYRTAGERFELNFAEDFADHRRGGWMRRCQEGAVVTPKAARLVPQTAQRGQGRIANPFPPNA